MSRGSDRRASDVVPLTLVSRVVAVAMGFRWDRNPSPNHRRIRNVPLQPWLVVALEINHTEVVGAASVATVQPWLMKEPGVAVATTHLVDAAAKREAQMSVPCASLDVITTLVSSQMA